MATDMATAHRIAHIETSRCSGCGRCISACAPRLFVFETHNWKKRAVLQDEDRCTGCGECEARCATGAVRLVVRTNAADRPRACCHSPP